MGRKRRRKMRERWKDMMRTMRRKDTEAWLAGPHDWLNGPEGGEGRNGWMDRWKENLPILQDFVSYWGRCPASPMKTR